MVGATSSSRMNNTKTGSAAEQLARKFLKNKGYSILHQNWRFGRFEIDLICQKGNDVIFVEVKYRKTEVFLFAEESVDQRKQNRLIKAANAYLNKNLHHGECRFDIVAMTGPELQPEIRHYKDAFYPSF